MNQTFDLITLLLILAALVTVLNARLFHLPLTIGLMLGTLILSLILLAFKAANLPFARTLIEAFSQVDFSGTLLYGLLSFLLFAGALQLDLHTLRQQKGVIFVLATVGVILSTFILGTLIYWVFHLLHLRISYLLCLTFGALISPTDPVSVVGLLKKSPLPAHLKMTVMGEALFNDGIAIALFLILSTLATLPVTYTPLEISGLIIQQLLGSLLLGFVFGWLTHFLLLHIEGYSEQILISLGLVAGGYDFAILLNISGPLTIVVMGLFVRNFGSHPTHLHFQPLYHFWSLLDELLNAALFLLLGLELLTLPPAGLIRLIAGLIAIPAVLLSRAISVWIPLRFFPSLRQSAGKTEWLLTWTGLRGGVSLALALSLPRNTFTNTLLVATYLVVVFSIVVQGLTCKWVLRHT